MLKLNRRVRNRSHGGVGGRRGQPRLLPDRTDDEPRKMPSAQDEIREGLLGFVRSGDEFSDGRDHGDDEFGAWFGRGVEHLPGLRPPLGGWMTVRDKQIECIETDFGDLFEMV